METKLESEKLKPTIRFFTYFLIVLHVIAMIAKMIKVSDVLFLMPDIFMMIFFIVCLYGLSKNKYSNVTPVRVITFLAFVFNLFVAHILVLLYVISDGAENSDKESRNVLLLLAIISGAKLVLYIFYYALLRVFCNYVKKEKKDKCHEEQIRNLEENKQNKQNKQNEVNSTEEKNSSGKTNSSEKTEENKK